MEVFSNKKIEPITVESHELLKKHNKQQNNFDLKELNE